jgi:hypothetical protein
VLAREAGQWAALSGGGHRAAEGKPADASGRVLEREPGRERKQARKGLFPAGPATGSGNTLREGRERAGGHPLERGRAVRAELACQRGDRCGATHTGEATGRTPAQAGGWRTNREANARGEPEPDRPFRRSER